jgi:[ribosomal protein S18]-alanine N-acetyltransferase
MAVLDTLRGFFSPRTLALPEAVIPAPPTEYTILPLTVSESDKVVRLNARCFRKGENYTKYTFAYLFGEPSSLSYQIVSTEGEMAAFVFVLVNNDGTGHLTTLGVAPEHRRRGLGIRLLQHLDYLLKAKGISTVVLEVRVGNTEAIEMYRKAGYATVNRIERYYTDGEDCFMMVRSIV